MGDLAGAATFLSNRKYRYRPYTQPDVGNCWPCIRSQGQALDESVSVEQTGPPVGPRTNDDRFQSLPESEKDKIMQILYILDHFNGSDMLWHEISMIFPDTPRSYLVWAYRRRLNQAFEVKKLPGEYNGAHLPLKNMIAADICMLMAKNNVENPEGQKFKIKFSGDGARFQEPPTF